MNVKNLFFMAVFAVLPVIANADTCIDFDDNMNVIEYECGADISTAKKQSVYKNTKSANYFSPTVKAALELLNNAGLADVDTKSDMQFVLGAGARYQKPSSKWFYDMDLTYHNMGYSASWEYVGYSLEYRPAYRDVIYFDDLTGEYVTDTVQYQEAYSQEYVTREDVTIDQFGVFATGGVGYQVLDKINLYALAGLGYVNINFPMMTANELWYRMGVGAEYSLFNHINAFGEFTYSATLVNLDYMPLGGDSSFSSLMFGIKAVF